MTPRLLPLALTAALLVATVLGAGALIGAWTADAYRDIGRLERALSR